MKIYFEFDMSNHESGDRGEVERAMRIDDAFGALWDIVEYLRDQSKWNSNLTDETSEFLDEIRDKISEIIYEHHYLDLNKLYS